MRPNFKSSFSKIPTSQLDRYIAAVERNLDHLFADTLGDQLRLAAIKAILQEAKLKTEQTTNKREMGSQDKN